jgi:hypothetical protein
MGIPVDNEDNTFFFYPGGPMEIARGNILVSSGEFSEIPKEKCCWFNRVN